MSELTAGTPGFTILEEWVSLYSKSVRSVEIFKEIPDYIWDVLISEGREKGETFSRWSVYRQICKMR